MTKTIDAPLQVFLVKVTPQENVFLNLFQFAVCFTEHDAHRIVMEKSAGQGLYNVQTMLIAALPVEAIMKDVTPYADKDRMPSHGDLPSAFKNTPGWNEGGETVTDRHGLEAAQRYKHLVMLARDKFAKTALERKVLDAVIERIGTEESEEIHELRNA